MIVPVAVSICVLAAVGAVIRVVRGPTLADRVVALEVGLTALMSAVTVYAVARDATELLLLPVIISIVGYVTSVGVSSHIEREGQAR